MATGNRTFSVPYAHTFPNKSPDQTSVHTKWAVSLVIAYANFMHWFKNVL